MINLEEIDLKDTLLSNSIQAELNGFSNLKSLDISWNKLKGSVDAQCKQDSISITLEFIFWYTDGVFFINKIKSVDPMH